MFNDVQLLTLSGRLFLSLFADGENDSLELKCFQSFLNVSDFLFHSHCGTSSIKYKEAFIVHIIFRPSSANVSSPVWQLRALWEVYWGRPLIIRAAPAVIFQPVNVYTGYIHPRLAEILRVRSYEYCVALRKLISIPNILKFSHGKDGAFHESISIWCRNPWSLDSGRPKGGNYVHWTAGLRRNTFLTSLQGGIYVITLVDWYATFPSLALFATMECIAISWCYGTSRPELSPTTFKAPISVY